MTETSTWIDGVDSLPLYTYIWTPDGVDEAAIKGTVTIIHGQAEHAARYARFAQALNQAGYAVVAADLRGHGKTTQLDRPNSEWGILGHMADDDGWNKAVADNQRVGKFTKRRFPNAKHFLFGHSLGCVIAQNVAIQHPDFFDGMMLTGCFGGLGFERSALRLLVWLQYFMLGPRAPGKWIDAVTFQRFLTPFQPVKTDADWLTRDYDECVKFIDDPLAGQPASCRHWIDFANGYEFVNRLQNIRYLRADMPISLWGGGQDTVSDFGKGFDALTENYKRAGLAPDVFFFEDCRHELLNEINRDDITTQMIQWFDRKL